MIPIFLLIAAVFWKLAYFWAGPILAAAVVYGLLDSYQENLQNGNRHNHDQHVNR